MVVENTQTMENVNNVNIHVQIATQHQLTAFHAPVVRNYMGTNVLIHVLQTPLNRVMVNSAQSVHSSVEHALIMQLCAHHARAGNFYITMNVSLFVQLDIMPLLTNAPNAPPTVENVHQTQHSAHHATIILLLLTVNALQANHQKVVLQPKQEMIS